MVIDQLRDRMDLDLGRFDQLSHEDLQKHVDAALKQATILRQREYTIFLRLTIMESLFLVDQSDESKRTIGSAAENADCGPGTIHRFPARRSGGPPER